MNVGLRDRVCHLMKHRKIVEHPEGSALRSSYQVLLAFLNHEVCYRHGRQVQPKGLPVLAFIERDVEARFGACIEQSLASRVFANYTREGVVGNAVRYLLPRLAEVAGLVEIRMI